MGNLISWFEIPVLDIERASKFYAEVFSFRDIQKLDLGNFKMALLPVEGDEIGGALCQGEWYKPSKNGVVIYMNGGSDLSAPLSKVEDAGGKILMPKKQISAEFGFMAMFEDSEGNRIALHSKN
jgi:hypothetical protein